MNKQISSFSRNDSKTLSHLELILNEDFQIALNVSFDHDSVETWRCQQNNYHYCTHIVVFLASNVETLLPHYPLTNP